MAWPAAAYPPQAPPPVSASAPAEIRGGDSMPTPWTGHPQALHPSGVPEGVPTSTATVPASGWSAEAARPIGPREPYQPVPLPGAGPGGAHGGTAEETAQRFCGVTMGAWVWSAFWVAAGEDQR